MIYPMTQKIYDVLCKARGPKPHIEELDDASAVMQPFPHEDGLFLMRFVTDAGSENDVRLRVYHLMQVDEDERLRMLPVINHLNGRYFYAKFYCDEEGYINVEYDYFRSDRRPEESVVEMQRRFVSIIRDAYLILKAERNDIRGVTPEEAARDVLAEMKAALEEQECACSLVELAVCRFLSVPIAICGEKNDVRFHFNERGALEMRLYRLLSLAKHERRIIRPLLADLNVRADGLEFECDRDGDVNLCYDYPRSVSDPAPSAYDMVRIAQEAAADAVTRLRAKLEQASGEAEDDEIVFAPGDPDADSDMDDGDECSEPEDVAEDGNPQWTMEELREELESRGCNCTLSDGSMLGISRLGVELRVEDRDWSIVFFRNQSSCLDVRMYDLIQVDQPDCPRVAALLDEINAGLTGVEAFLDFKGAVNLRYNYSSSDGNPVHSAYDRMMRFIAVAPMVTREVEVKLKESVATKKWTLESIRARMQEMGYRCRDIRDGMIDIQYMTAEIPVDGQVYDLDFFQNNGRLELNVFRVCILEEEEERQRVEPVIEALNALDNMLSYSCDCNGEVDIEYTYPEDIEDPEDTLETMVLRITRAIARVRRRVLAAAEGTEQEPWTLDSIREDLECCGYQCTLQEQHLSRHSFLTVQIPVDDDVYDLDFFERDNGRLGIHIFDLAELTNEQCERIKPLLDDFNVHNDLLELNCNDLGALNISCEYPGDCVGRVSSVYELVQCFVAYAREALPLIRKVLDEGNGQTDDDSGPSESTIMDIRAELVRHGYDCDREDGFGGAIQYLTVHVLVDGERKKLVFVKHGDLLGVHMFRVMCVDDVERRRIDRLLEEISAGLGELEICCDKDGDVGLHYDYPKDADVISDVHSMVQRFTVAAEIVLKRIHEELGICKPGWTMRELSETLKESGFSCDLSSVDDFGLKYVTVKVHICGESYDVDFVKCRNRNLRVHMFRLVSGLNKTARQHIAPVIAALNGGMDDLKVECDKDGDVNLCYDFRPDEDPISEAGDLVNRFISAARKVIDKVNAELQRTAADQQSRWSVERIDRVLQAAGFDSEVIDLEQVDTRIVSVRIEVEGVRDYIQFIALRPGRMDVRLFGLLQMESREDCERVKPMLQFLNAKVDMVRFECDEDGDVNICYEYPPDTADPSDMASVIVQRFIDAVREALPLRRIFGDEE